MKKSNLITKLGMQKEFFDWKKNFEENKYVVDTGRAYGDGAKYKKLSKVKRYGKEYNRGDLFSYEDVDHLGAPILYLFEADNFLEFQDGKKKAIQIIPRKVRQISRTGSYETSLHNILLRFANRVEEV